MDRGDHMHGKVHRIEDMSMKTYGVCCSTKGTCSLSYESEDLGLLGQLLQTPDGFTTFKGTAASFTRFFQSNTATCSICHQPAINNTRLPLGNNVNVKRLDRVLRLRNQLLGLGILPI
jgi:hypothetical protein